MRTIRSHLWVLSRPSLLWVLSHRAPLYVLCCRSLLSDPCVQSDRWLPYRQRLPLVPDFLSIPCGRSDPLHRYPKVIPSVLCVPWRLG